MNTATVPGSLYRGAGWAAAAIVGGTVAVIRYIDGAVGRVATLDEMKAASDAVMADPATKAAEARFKALCALADEAEAGDDEAKAQAADAAANAAAVVVRIGMLSGGEFCHTFSKAEKKRIGWPA